MVPSLNPFKDTMNHGGRQVSNDIDKQPRKRSIGQSLLWVGIVLLSAPFACLAILIVSTGHAVQPGIETLFFSMVYLGFISGVFLAPIGLAVLIYSIVAMVRDK